MSIENPRPAGDILQAEHDENVDAKRIIDITNLVPDSYDYIEMGYSGSNMTSCTFKSGGSTGSIITTLTFTYDSSGNITSIEKS